MEMSGILPSLRERFRLPRPPKEPPFWPGASEQTCKAWKDAEKKTQLQMRIVQEAIREVTQPNPKVATVIGIFLQEAHVEATIISIAQERRSYLRQYTNELGAVQAATDDRYQREIGDLFTGNPENDREFPILSARAAGTIKQIFGERPDPSPISIINSGLVPLINQLNGMIPVA